jgi:hypothetical protein
MASLTHALSNTSNSLHITLPAQPIPISNAAAEVLAHPDKETCPPASKKDTGTKQITIQLPSRATEGSTAPGAIKSTSVTTAGISGIKDEDEPQCTFCPVLYCELIIKMIEKHYCAHPLIPGYAYPSAEGIKKWAVQQMYNFCMKYDLRKVWAYLRENWYQKSCWELWACSAHPLIPILKTTMILESQYVNMYFK